MTLLIRILPIIALGLLTGAAGRGGRLRSVPSFKELETAFQGQFTVSEGPAGKVEFCPDNTCYAFEPSRGVSDKELSGFIYLYLFYSSDYIHTEAWQSKPENALRAGEIAAKLGPKSCGAPAGVQAGLCVLNSLMSKKAVKVYDVRYDENERFAVPVIKAVLGRTGEIKACREFTESFIAWYVPLVLRDSSEPASVLAIRRKPAIFSDRLRKSLEEDRKAQEQSKDIVGIDFDPFLSAQDPAEKYLVEKVTVEDGKCLADIKADKSNSWAWDVRAEAKQRDGAWRFTNFHYNTSIVPNDLLSILRDLKRGRLP
jgi:hypothetical protein